MIIWRFKIHIIIIILFALQGLQNDLIMNNELKTDGRRILNYLDINGYVDNIIKNHGEQEKQTPCLLGESDNYTISWVYENGTLRTDLKKNLTDDILDFSSYNIRADDRSDFLYQQTQNKTNSHKWHIIAFSAANNLLRKVPFEALSLINDTLKFLSLRGNNFSINGYEIGKKTKNFIINDWAKFPIMDYLKELDLRNCHINYLGTDSFKNLTNLTNLYLGYNKFVHIEKGLFSNLQKVVHLDLSHIDSISSMRFTVTNPAYEPYLRIIEGLDIPEDGFINLINLKHLDLSYTKLVPTSAWAFTYLGESVQYLSLCYSSFPLIPKGIFTNTSLRVLDISGNSQAAARLYPESFEGVEDTLEILSLEKSNIENLNWIKNLSALKVLKLASNNINMLTNETFTNLKHLQVLDLNSNHISNWYYRVLENNRDLSVLNLRNNNINIITTEMYRDLSDLTYLALGHNNFVCHCILRDLIEIAAKNNKNVTCTESITNALHLKSGHLRIANVSQKKKIYDNEYKIIQSELVKNLIPTLSESYSNMLEVTRKLKRNIVIYNEINYRSRLKVRGSVGANYDPCTSEVELENLSIDGYPTLSYGEELKFQFQLLDYSDKDYWCFNESVELQFADIERCTAKSYVEDEENHRNFTKHFIIGLVVILLFLTLSAIVYFKWWYIRYFFITVRNSAVLSLMDKAKNKHKNSDDSKNNNEKRSQFVYDLFISYCDSNRDWVLDELLPNMEKITEITVCLHERDFLVGMSILENIISCMDRSRCLLLVISKDFLRSQWCQFEMHLAQHRLLETRKENLILILLEDIPKEKRPKILHYLMQVKTYIKWPAEGSTGNFSKSLTDERKLFWKRLRKSISDEWRSIEETEA